MLTTDNVVAYPVAEGSIYFGQKLSDGITLNCENALVTTDGTAEGTIIPGSWEFVDKDYAPNYADSGVSGKGLVGGVRFIPDDTTAYAGFEYTKLSCSVSNTTPIVVKAPAIEGTVDSGKRLLQVSITNGSIINPYTGNEVENQKWTFVNRTAKVTTSGYYDARLSVVGYEYLTVSLYIRVTGDTSEEKLQVRIEELPTVVGTYYAGDDLSSIELIGGKVVDATNGLPVPGKFAVNQTGSFTGAGTKTVGINFVPDSELYSTAQATIRVTANAAAIKFVDATGNEIIPEISTIHNAIFGETLSIGYSLANYLPSNQNSFEYFDMEGNSLEGTLVPMGRNEIKVKVSTKDTNYTSNILTFILNVEPKAFTATASYDQVNGRIKVQISDNLPAPGEFDVYVDGELIGTTTDKVIMWSTNVSDTYDVELVYKDEEGRYALENGKQEMTVSIRRQVWRGEALSFTVTGGDKSNNNYAYKGNVLTVECADAAFYSWKIGDANGEDYLPEGLTAEDLTKSSISFTMPDHDIVITANSAEDHAADANCDHLCHRTGFVSYIWKVISFLQRLFGVQQYCDCGVLHYDAPFVDLGL